MTVSLCAVSGTTLDPTGTAIVGAVVKSNLTAPTIDVNNNVLLQHETQTTTDSSGNFTLNLVQGTSQIVAFEFPPNSTDSNRRVTFSIIVPSTSTANFYSLVMEI